MAKEINEALLEEGKTLLADARSVLDDTIKLVELIENLPARIEAAAQASCNSADAAYTAIRDTKSDLADKLLRLEELPPVDVPFGIERLLDIAKKCEDLSDTAWNRLKELAIALKK